MSRKFNSQFVDPKGVILADQRGNGLLVTGSGAPTASASGYAIGAVYARSDGAAGTAFYINEGTASSSTWVAMGTGVTLATQTVTALTATTATITTLVNVTGTRSSAAATDTYKANTAAAYSLSDGTTSLYVVDSRSAVTVQNHVFDAPASQTLPTGATSRYRMVSLNAHTVTLAGTTQVTTVNQGATLHLGAPTYAQSGGAVTVDQVSTLHVAVPVAGSSVTITANRHISTGVSDCYLTSGGVWTDTACWEEIKEGLVRGGQGASDLIAKVMSRLLPATWKYQDGFEAEGVDESGRLVKHRSPLNDFGRERVGIVYNDLPDELRAPGEARAVSAGLLASFALAALKTLWDRNQALEARLDALEAV